MEIGTKNKLSRPSLERQMKQMTETNPKKKTKSARLKEIIQVFLAHDVIRNFSQQKNPLEVRKAFEELGPTFIKIGQMLSVRTDLLSPSYINTLKTLQDNVKSDPYSIVKEIIEQELELSLTDIFDSIDEEPFASASIGQAHKAILKNKESVVIKVQHPGIREAIELDLALFEKAIPLINYIPESNVVDLNSVLKEVRRSLDDELNFLKECQSGKHFFEKNNHWRQIKTPKMYEEFSTKKILVMEFMEGKSLKYLLGADNREIAYNQVTNHTLKKEISSLLVDNFIKQVFEDGFFHADPHPGNIFLHLPEETLDTEKKQPSSASSNDSTEDFTPDYEVIYLDFGMMGTISETLRGKLSTALIALYSKDSKRIGKAVLQLCNQEGSFDEGNYYSELETFLETYYDLPIKEIDLQKLFYQVVMICHNNHLQIDQTVTMLVKAFGTLEGVIEELNPELSMMEVAAPFAQRYFLQRMNIKEELMQGGLDLLSALKSMPKIPEKAVDTLDTFSSGKTKVTISLKEQERLVSRFENLMNRFLIGLILASLIIGTSILLRGTDLLNLKAFAWLSALVYAFAAFSALFFLFELFYRWLKRRKK
ncbi:hypothetical protein RV11_GL002960 [Enterococcus phoeniculicola]|jgi:ubiquinone biosynthesis protein|uniref:ABC1 atypical kinase-like domain-containing protein n=2 Tax=Enterococcus phoeniculicola TaxID=154621 RepID=R3TNK1_9ENTE|nr:hypothetical protein UC3_02991 [Enterococcus phoeniculicola ATCC BAA-412]EOT79078.1 hypothetical protein I589_00585 [Enterococcus phoeniculicola ATCC BAA-412]OJG72378.1 hypothetical protein RV11_GL002960 [Enterococcus phoeniculicola]